MMKRNGEILGWQPYGQDLAASGITSHPARIGSVDARYFKHRTAVESEIAEVLVWNQALSDEEIEQVEGCLCSKYYPVGSLGSINSLLHTLIVFSRRGDHPGLRPDQVSPQF